MQLWPAYVMKERAVSLENPYVQGHLAGQCMGGAGVAGIVGSECHLHHVQNPIRDLSLLD